MEGIINLTQQMGKEGKGQWEAPGRMWFPQKEVLELPCRDMALLCMAAAWNLSKLTQETIVIFPPNSNLLCANLSVFIAGYCFSSKTMRNPRACMKGISWGYHSDPAQHREWHLLAFKHRVSFKFHFLWLVWMQCPLVKYLTSSTLCKGPTVQQITVILDILAPPVVRKLLKPFDSMHFWQTNKMGTVKFYHTLQSQWTSRSTYTVRRKLHRLWGSSDTFT